MRLYLLRHAKSDWSQPGLADRDRPLSARGRRALPVIGGYLAGANPPVDLVLCSPARRARETVAGVSECLASVVPVEYDEALYAASAAQLLDRVRALPHSIRCALICGHNPGLQELAVMLSRDSEPAAGLRRAFPTAALVVLDADGEWPALAPGGCTLTAFVSPKSLAEGAARSPSRDEQDRGRHHDEPEHQP